MERAFDEAAHKGGRDGENVRIGESTLPGAGRGVFAKRDLAKSTWITTYHGTQIPSRLVASSDVAYSIDFPPVRDTSIVGETSPGPTEGVAQLVNDAINPAVCGVANNCDLYFYRPKETWVLVASRDILASEELFVAYGYGYWRTRFLRARQSTTTTTPVPPHLAWLDKIVEPIELLRKAGLLCEFADEIRVVYQDRISVLFRASVRATARCHLPVCGAGELPFQKHPPRGLMEVEVEHKPCGRRGDHVLRIRCVACGQGACRFTV